MWSSIYSQASPLRSFLRRSLRLSTTRPSFTTHSGVFMIVARAAPFHLVSHFSISRRSIVQFVPSASTDLTLAGSNNPDSTAARMADRVSFLSVLPSGDALPRTLTSTMSPGESSTVLSLPIASLLPAIAVSMSAQPWQKCKRSASVSQEASATCASTGIQAEQ